MNSTSYLSLGTNLGIKINNLKKALYHLKSSPKIRVLQLSSIYLTEPIEMTEQPFFLNSIVKISTQFYPNELLEFIKDIEKQMGRTPTPDKGPRIIDIDIILFENLTINEPSLQIPHPGLYYRKFILVPLAELNPNLIIEKEGITVKEYLEEKKFSGIVKKIDEKTNFS